MFGDHPGAGAQQVHKVGETRRDTTYIPLGCSGRLNVIGVLTLNKVLGSGCARVAADSAHVASVDEQCTLFIGQTPAQLAEQLQVM
jgi:hypothetical protein